ncbi:hypothetical protein PsorP6_008758 [Peronosclerospora sorghi]|uniref:Uncharacterized protein n=1 Tax=Peronosclerospora sorghi TaxID=230839 RepID=A0ACC0W1B5_9STRA|nr:hypothetical protein PsorP6_008758 [Peronosclerospora sorghi]
MRAPIKMALVTVLASGTMSLANSFASKDSNVDDKNYSFGVVMPADVSVESEARTKRGIDSALTPTLTFSEHASQTPEQTDLNKDATIENKAAAKKNLETVTTLLPTYSEEDLYETVTQTDLTSESYEDTSVEQTEVTPPEMEGVPAPGKSTEEEVPPVPSVPAAEETPETPNQELSPYPESTEEDYLTPAKTPCPSLPQPGVNITEETDKTDIFDPPEQIISTLSSPSEMTDGKGRAPCPTLPQPNDTKVPCPSLPQPKTPCPLLPQPAESAAGAPDESVQQQQELGEARAAVQASSSADLLAPALVAVAVSALYLF